MTWETSSSRSPAKSKRFGIVARQLLLGSCEHRPAHHRRQTGYPDLLLSHRDRGGHSTRTKPCFSLLHENPRQCDMYIIATRIRHVHQWIHPKRKGHPRLLGQTERTTCPS